MNGGFELRTRLVHYVLGPPELCFRHGRGRTEHSTNGITVASGIFVGKIPVRSTPSVTRRASFRNENSLRGLPHCLLAADLQSDRNELQRHEPEFFNGPKSVSGGRGPGPESIRTIVRSK